MKINKELDKEIKKIHKSIEKDVDKRLKEFKKVWNDGTEEEIFVEMAFCVLTPQSKARNAWTAISNLKENNLLEVSTLGGGTALAAYYLNHRYSTDIDIFIYAKENKTHLLFSIHLY